MIEPTFTLASRIATHHGGKVHFAVKGRSPYMPGKFVEVPACQRNGGNIIGTVSVVDGAAITCIRCQAAHDKAVAR